jgi:hypothetical protein
MEGSWVTAEVAGTGPNSSVSGDSAQSPFVLPTGADDWGM